MYFPVFIDLSEKKILAAGGGTIAARRVRTLGGFAGQITVVAPEIAEEIASLAGRYPIRLIHRGFEPSDLDGADLVLAATDDPALNREIAALCRERKIPVNVCSDQTLCDFQFPSVVQEGDIVIGINASGKDHGLVKKTRKQVEQMLGAQDSLYD